MGLEYIAYFVDLLYRDFVSLLFYYYWNAQRKDQIKPNIKNNSIHLYMLPLIWFINYNIYFIITYYYMNVGRPHIK